MDDVGAPPNPCDGRHPGYPGRQIGEGHVGMPPRVPVLVAEHDADSRNVMSLALMDKGYILHVVTDGGAALDFLRKARPPLVVIAEEELPEIGGFQLAGLLSLKRAAEARYSVVVLTADLGSALHHSLYRRMDALALEVLVKPFHNNELLMAVEMASERLTGTGISQDRVGG